MGYSRGAGYVIQQEFPVMEAVIRKDFQGRGGLEEEISKEGGYKSDKNRKYGVEDIGISRRGGGVKKEIPQPSMYGKKCNVPICR